MNARIADTAVVHDGAKLGENVTVGHGSVIYAETVIGDNTEIGEFCVIGKPTDAGRATHIGGHSIIRSHSVIYDGSTFGDQFQTGHHTMVRSATTAGTNVRIGSYTDIEGDCRIGDYARMHGYVHVGQGSRIGNFVWLYSLVTLTNDPLPPSHVESPVIIHDGAVLCVGVTPLPGITIGEGAFIPARVTIATDVPAGAFLDNHGRIAGPVTHLMELQTGNRHPWMNHFADAYPSEAQAAIAELRTRIRDAARNVQRSSS